MGASTPPPGRPAPWYHLLTAAAPPPNGGGGAGAGPLRGRGHGSPVTAPRPHRQYYWYDERGKKVKCTAPQYVDFVMSSVQKLVTDEDVFPTKYGRSLAAPGRVMQVGPGRGSRPSRASRGLAGPAGGTVGPRDSGPRLRGCRGCSAGACWRAACRGPGAEAWGRVPPSGRGGAGTLTVRPRPAGREFPSSFESLVKRICRHLFHVLAHIYSSHFKETLALELHGHLNTLYVHFILFAREFNLLDPKETAVMDDLTEVLCSGGGRGGGGGDGAGGGGPGAQNHVKER